MLTPDYLKNVADDAVKLYSKLENSIIKDVVRRLKDTDFEMTESARFQIQIAQESGMLYDDVIKKVAYHSGMSEKMIKKTFQNSVIEALKYDDKIYKRQGLNPIPLKQSKTMLELLKNTLNKTNGSLYNLTLTTAATTQSKFIEVCNDTYMKIASGAFDYNRAIKQATRQFDDGIQVQYDSGYKLNIKSAVKRAVMTGVNQTCLKMQEERANEMGCDLVEVTAHAGARPEHAEWQGKVYSRSGKSKKYPPLRESTGYGSGAGLGGWNCRHNMFPYYEGMSRAYTDKELEELKPTKENDIILTNEEKLALNNYISSDSYKINEKLRNNIELDEKYINLRNNLDSALNKCNNYEGNIVRVLDIANKDKLNDFIKYNEIGKEVSFYEYLSFSNKNDYNSGANVFIYVKSKSAKDIRKYNPQESEILYKRNSKFFVENVQKVDDKIYILWRDIND